MSDLLFIVQLRGAATPLTIAAELFSDLDVNMATWQHVEEETGLLTFYTDSREEADALHADLGGRLLEMADWLPGELQLLPVSTLAREDWAESWKRYFRPIRISNRLSIRPSWEPPSAVDGEHVIVLDPGNSFGTGQHATTVACLQLLDELALAGARGPVADLGCGSGILAIGAVLIGLGPVDACDYDPVAVATTVENCEVNRVLDSVSVSEVDVTAWQPPRTWPIVVANILAPILIQSAGTLAAAVDPDGHLILSGILAEQFDEVAAAIGAHGFRLVRAVQLEVWKTGLFHR